MKPRVTSAPGVGCMIPSRSSRGGPARGSSLPPSRGVSSSGASVNRSSISTSTFTCQRGNAVIETLDASVQPETPWQAAAVRAGGVPVSPSLSGSSTAQMTRLARSRSSPYRIESMPAVHGERFAYMPPPASHSHKIGAGSSHGLAPDQDGGGEIRTPGTPIRRTTVFETAAFNRSATPPGQHRR